MKGRNRRNSDLRDVFLNRHSQTTYCSHKDGLFSAVVTSFAVDSYKWLQLSSQDLSHLTIQYQALIFHQLNNSSSNVESNISLGSAMNNSNATVWEIRTNILWFLSLLRSYESWFCNGFESFRRNSISNAKTHSLCGRCGLRVLSAGMSQPL